MGYSVLGSLAVAGALTFVTGCAGLAPARGTADIDKAVAERGAPPPQWPQSTRSDDGESAAPLTEVVTRERAVQLAFMRNAKIRETYAELGIAQADVLEASRIVNPTLSYSDLEPRGGSGRGMISRGVSIGFVDLLLAPVRGRIARTAFESARDRAGDAVLALQMEAEKAWFEYVNALQVADMRAAVALAAESSAEYAQRLHDAGNIPPRTLALELATASEARVDAVRAKSEALHARAELAQLIGASTREGWSVPKELPAPLGGEDPGDAIVDEALAARLDLSATRREISALEAGLRTTRRWRWLGDFELGYERETEGDGAQFRGPSFAWQVPLFNRNADGVLRAQGQLEAARAALTEEELEVRNDVALGLDRLASAREIAESYRTALIPQREAVVDRAQEEVNFMLLGAFELLEAKREQFDAYQEYLEAVRDYWVARVELRKAAGGRLPGDDQPASATLGVDAVFAPQPAVDHSKMDHSKMDHSKMPHEGDAPAQPKDDGESR
jgi:cobalt-zinc-cadmium efflux system outer membrane protein